MCHGNLKIKQVAINPKLYEKKQNKTNKTKQSYQFGDYNWAKNIKIFIDFAIFSHS